MKVTSNKTIDFPSLGWGITKGETKDLPEEKEAGEVILQNPNIQEASSGAKSSSKKDEKAEEDK